MVQYLSNMTPDTAFEHFQINVDCYLLTASKKGRIELTIVEGPINEDECVDELTYAFEDLFTVGKTWPFYTWGNYQGTGTVLTITDGKPCRITIFAYSGKKYSFVVMIKTLDNNDKKDKPGLKLFESSFRLK